MRDQVWVTSALSDDHVEKALLLCYSLKRTHTSRIVAVIASPSISPNLRNALNFGFDLVFYLTDNQIAANLNHEDFAKLYSMLALRSYKNCAYVSRSMLALKNCDDIFAEQTDGLVILKNDTKAHIFLFKPSFYHFKALEAGLKNASVTIESGIGSYFKNWINNQFTNIRYLDEKFNKVIQPGIAIVGRQRDISFVNLINYPQKSDIKTLESAGIIENLIARHWFEIWNENVRPLMELSSSVGSLINAHYPFVPSYKKEPIAIIGMSCRFPGSNNLEEFWELMFQGKDGTCNPPPFRWTREQCSRQMAHARNTNAGFLKVPVDEFDAKFFGISPKEMVFMDPQHRLMHELIWEGLEDACIDPQTLRGTPGSIFMGSWTNDYKDIMVHSGNVEFYRAYMGNSIGAATARLSFLLGLTGPSMATESGCSSAMVAVHLACKSLLNGETNLALVGGVNLLLHPFDKDELPMVISPEGRCKTFAKDADGFARAEGCGVLILKKLSDALRDNDKIWGLIRGSAVAQEGISNSMGTPTVHCEALAMNDALEDAYVKPEEVSYVEAHGTGTIVGDPMEVAAIAKAYHSPSRRGPLIIGSVKTNVGHTESCSGITGIMKVVLSMHHELIPAHRNFTELNPIIDLDIIPAIIPLEGMEWKRMPENPRISGVSSFGITGTDAHAIIEDPPQINITNPLTVDNSFQRPVHILKISAKTEEALEILLIKYTDMLKSTKEPLENIAYSSNIGRDNFNFRAVILAKDKDDAVVSIEQQKYLKSEVNIESLGKVCFLFSGQGSQYPGLAKKLYDTSPVFQMHFDYCLKILNDTYNIYIKDFIWSDNTDVQTGHIIYSHVSIFCVEYALVKLWESWGVKADYVLGHGLGEFTSAVCAGLISVEDAIKLVVERSNLIDKLPRGKLLVIQADYDEVQNQMSMFCGKYTKKTLEYAAINSSEETMVTGDSDVVHKFSQFCTENKMKCKIISGSNAFRSKCMDAILNKYRAVTATINVSKSQACQYISGIKGELITGNEVDADYWTHHSIEKVNFLNASKTAVQLGCNIFIEIGPGTVLCELTMLNNDTNASNLLCLPSLNHRKADDWETILNTLGKLYLAGIEVDWNGVDEFYNRKKVHSLPHYPFIGKKFWPDVIHATSNAIHPLIGSALPNATSTKLFQSAINLSTHEYIKDHAIGKTVIFPGAGYLEISLAAGLATVENSVEFLALPSRPMKVDNLIIKAPLALDDVKTCQLQTIIEYNDNTNDKNGWNDLTVKIFHQNKSEIADKWVEHAVSKFSPVPSAEEQVITFDVAEFHKKISSVSNEDAVTHAYDKLASIGLKFGPIFRSLEKVWRKEEDSSLLAKVKVPEYTDGHAQSGQYIIHPVILDAMIQAIMMMRITSKLKSKIYVPIKIGKFIWLSNSFGDPEEKYVHVYESNRHNGDLSPSNSIALLVDSTGKVLAKMEQVEFIDTTVKAIESILEQQTSKMPDMWEETWRAKIGHSQNRFDLSICSKDNIFDDDFIECIEEKFNKPTPELRSTLENLENLVYYNFLRCLYQCGWEPRVDDVFIEDELRSKLDIKNDFVKMFGYMMRVLEEEGILENLGSSSWKVVSMPPSMHYVQVQLSSAKLKDDLVQAFTPSLLLTKLGENYSAIFRGTQSVLPILFPEEGPKAKWPAVEDFYTGYGKLLRFVEMCNETLSTGMKYFEGVDALSTFRILEVGAGTGFYSKNFIECLEKGNIKFEYTYTDISSAFFAAAEKKFEPHLKILTFKKLNIEEDPINQGFTPNYYDWVVASDVIHATKNVNEALMNVAMLLKPGGKFDMVEQTKVSRVLTYLFGVLDGFWRFEDLDTRPHHCSLSKGKWAEVLELAGFDILKAFSCANDNHSIIMSKKAKNSCMKIQNWSTKKFFKSWILFQHDDSPMSNSIKYQMSLIPNRRLIVVRRGKGFQMFKNDDSFEYIINPDCEDDYLKIFQAIKTSGQTTIEGVIYCWSLDKTCTTQESVLKPYFHLVKSLLSLKQSPLPKLVILLDGIVPIEDNDLSHFYTSTIWGFTKALNNERLDLNCTCIDIGGNETTNGVEQVFYELFSTDKETVVAFQDTTRYICRLQALKPALSDLKLPNGTDRFQLILPETKSITDLQFGPLDPFVLGEEDIEIQVKASALNFRDLFSVLKPTEKFKDVNAVGFDFAGKIKRVGSKVSLWSVGDRVFGVNANGAALPSHIHLNQHDVLPIPEGMTINDACTLPAVVATSYHCLIDVAKITAQDTVLIHTASGGVGLSAVQICQNIGSTIIATAGSKRKRNYLRSLGIQHVFHSRNLKYAEEILEVTNGRGVDVVLNSLTSEGFKEATLKACAKNARFVEMSKLSIWEPEEVKQLRPDVKYTIADVSSMESPEWRRLMTTLKELADKEIVKPIPYVRFDGIHIREALQYLQKAKHIGKVVCAMPEVRIQNGNSEMHTSMFNENAAYLITGGLGGIGFVVCRWMVEKGARNVLVAGRTPPSKLSQQSIDDLNREHGANVIAVQLDVSDFKQCRELIQVQIAKMKLPPLRGVMHAAGTLSDGLIENHLWETVSSTFPAKVDGTLNLHEITKNLNLEHFVLFSSLASVIGSPGQCNHSAGNNFEDAFAHYRNSIGLPATTVNWGQWGEVGVATEVDLPGIKSLSNLQGTTGLEYALKSQRTQTAIINVESFVLMSKLFPHISSMLDERVWIKASSTSASGAINMKSEEFWQQYDNQPNIDFKKQIVKDMLQLTLRNVLRLEETDVIEDHSNFQEMGVDSLMFVEIKNTIQSVLGDRVKINAGAMRDCNTMVILTDALVKVIEGGEMEEESVPTLEEVAQLIKEDCQLPDHIIVKAEEQDRVNIKDISTVLLTGSTGTLGSYVLRELTMMPQVKQVICLLRSSKNLSGDNRLRKILQEKEIISQVNMDKVQCINGNLILDKLGMESNVWEEMCDKIDAIFHCAAHVAHTEHYRKRKSDKATRAVNVEGTKNILEFACRGNKVKHVYLASSLLAVTTVDEVGSLSENWPQHNDYDNITTAAYPITKFVGDMLMKEAVVERGIPGKVFRFPLIVGDSRTGRFDLDNNHAMLRYLFILKHGAMPNIPMPVIVLPVDECASISVKIFFNSDAPNEVYNVSKINPDVDQEFVGVAKKLGYNVNVVELAEFTEKIRDSTSNDSPFSIFKDFYKSDQDILSLFSTTPALQQWITEGGTNERFAMSKKIEKLLPEIYKECGSGMECIQRDLLFAKGQGMFDKFNL